jgi:hypothetical protein
MGTGRGFQILRVNIALSCLVILASCNSQKPINQETPKATLTPPISAPVVDSTPVTPNPATPDVTIPLQVPPIFAENTSPTPPINPRTQYNLDAVFNYNQHSLEITETINYVNSTTESLANLILVVEANRRPTAFTLESLTWQGGENIEAYDLTGDRLKIPLPDGLVSGEGVIITIKYALEIPEIAPPSDESRPLPYGYTERQTNIVDWYPYIPPYQPGKGWLVNKNWWFGEHQVLDIADYQVTLTLAEPVQDLVIAASAPAQQDGDTYTYHLQAARSFALSASNEYLVQTASAGDVTIYSYSFPYDKSAAAEVLQNTADALQLFSQLIMPYPHSTLSVVEADFLDGMEYDGLYFLSHGFYNLYDGTPKGYLTFIAAHETAHQWWYGLVGNDQALEPWLDEAMCTYMEHIFYENIYADYPPGSGQSLVDWWWYYRINFYEPTGWVDGTIYDFNQFRPYRDAVYLNGAKFLDDLRILIGDEVFYAFLRDYAEQEKLNVATATDFFAVLRAHTNQDLDELLAQYFQVAK